jgi:predicted  nucleic acid-binding Zn-ribbon protein
MNQKEIIESLDFQFIDPYINCSTKTNIKCLKCGQIFKIRPDSLVRTKIGCKCRAKYNKGTLLSIEEISKRLQEKGFKLISKEYKGRSKPIEVQCFCGKIYITTYGRIQNDGCCGCRAKKYFKRIQNKRVYEEISERYMSQYSAQAERRGLDFNLTAKDIWNLYLKQDRKCCITGEELVFSSKTQTSSDTTVSIDRMDISKGYTIGNIRIVHKIINKIKWDFEDEYFLQLCYNICYPEKIVSNKIKKPSNWLSVVCSIRSCAKERNIYYDIDENYLFELATKQNGLCAISHIPLIFEKNNRTASLDRIDNTKGYIEGNVWWVHKHINKIKRTLTIEELQSWSRKVIDYYEKNYKNNKI